ncbi:hypothetical protein FNV43_RR26955 [Rhamnella rubrinervis]|uniref:Uncharacterized protein n=1 Tax=Rhamnella rubrinervis TaxID=2594499 RepID=A0A8K0DKQ6_9ROSA|nr:hypothetical protein FNV43_RR26955 [Rhamnella rubrinervis]
MKLKETLLTLMVALIAVLELKTEEAFDAHPITMVTFCVIFAIYGILLLADELVQQPNENDYGGIMPKAILCFGSLGVVILLLTIIPVLGWSLLVLWFLCRQGFFQQLYDTLRLWLLYQSQQILDNLTHAMNHQPGVVIHVRQNHRNAIDPHSVMGPGVEELLDSENYQRPINRDVVERDTGVGRRRGDNMSVVREQSRNPGPGAKKRNQALGGELEAQSHGFEAGIGEDLSGVDEFREGDRN